MNLENIPTIKGATHPIKRLGRGEGSGHGKTSGKGHKGQKARAGGGIRIGFEGGQMPLYRKLPRRGFNNKNFKISYQLVNVGDLDKLEGGIVNRETLVCAGLIRDNDQGVKLLGDGEISKAFTVDVNKVSETAKNKIVAAGGNIAEAIHEDKTTDEGKAETAENKDDV
ncbi:MAG: 50S ribosomal protein L15 [Verrucomicrobiota bacterium]|nr:50S ribosomal protein L15 [Verrucomicrobiota bacterium]MEC8332559.1 50S ribosomal protein L15 [Verrucomicrobiota bacterium]